MAPKPRVVGAKHQYFDDYFVLPHPLWMIIILFGLWLLVISTISPERIPPMLGPVAAVGRYMGKTHPLVCNILCIFTVVCHCGEALYASKLCQDKALSLGATIKWTLSTMIFGFSALIRLKPYQSTSKLD